MKDPGQLATRNRIAGALGGALPPPGARIGLLGGSFNPAHRAHRDISLEALKRLELDQVWWLVSPQNPLKSSTGMADLDSRLERAKTVAGHSKIRAAALESLLGTRYTVDSLRALTNRLPRVQFVWLMGADNLIQVEKWQNWPQIFHAVPVAIFDRPSYALSALAAKAARRFARYRVLDRNARDLASMEPPAWVFFHNRLNPLSATEIRSRRSQDPASGDGRRKER